ncbi:MAG: thioredoxin family protein [Lysobacteraceae bacterium]
MTRTALTLTLAALFAAPAALAASIGEAAPAFTLADSHGKSHSLADYHGKTVILEWTNHECPFVKKHYGAGNMQAQQRAAVADGIVWLTINSSNVGQQGHVDADFANKLFAESYQAANTAYLFDTDGVVGRAYGAKTTPQMYIIDADGVLRYNGAIDSIPSADQADIADATQHVSVALAELAAGKPVGVPLTQPYGCSVKY